MGLLQLFKRFGKSGRAHETEEDQRKTLAEDLELYSGMRVEVSSEDKQVFLVASLVDLWGDQARLKPLNENGLLTEEPVPVSIRGYSSLDRKAVLIEGTIRPGASGLLEAENLVLIKRSNDRAFFRVGTNIEAYITPMGSFSAEEETCKVLNISVGGVCLGSKGQHNVGDKFIMRVKLLKELEPSLMFCQVLRILERKEDYFEYGCQFLRLTASDEERILQIIFDLQRKQR